LWRDWLTEGVITELGLSDRQMKAVVHVKMNGRITNKEYQQLTGVTDRTVLREFKDLLDKGVLQKVGETGRGTYYVLKRQTRHKPDKPDKGRLDDETRHKPDKRDIRLPVTKRPNGPFVPSGGKGAAKRPKGS
jgi:hypothetical protein